MAPLDPNGRPGISFPGRSALIGLIDDPATKTWTVASAIRILVSLPGDGIERLGPYLASDDVVRVEAALAGLARTDTPQDAFPLLLSRSATDRARVAIYAATRCARFVPVTELSGVLEDALAGNSKITSRKEMLRLIGQHRTLRALSILSEIATRPEVHRDLRIAAGRSLRTFLDEEPAWSALETARAGDPESVTVEVVGPIWRVRGTDAKRIDFGGHVASIGGLPGALVVVCRMQDGPRIKRLRWGGGVSHLYPASVRLDTGDGSFVVIGKLRSGSRLIATRDGTLLLAIVEGDDEFTLRLIDTDRRRIDDPLQFAASWLEEFLHLGFLGDDRVASLSGSPGAGPMTLSVGSFAAGPTSSVVLSDKTEWRSFAVSSSLIWCWRTDVPQLLAIDPASLEVRDILVPIDTTPYAPEIGVPQIDFAAHDQAQLAQLRSAFLRTQDDGSGDIWHPIDGVTFESVELVGEFPDTAVVGLFSIENHPARRFGRRRQGLSPFRPQQAARTQTSS